MAYGGKCAWRIDRVLLAGRWMGAAQATAAGLSIAVGGAVRDGVGAYALHGNLGAAFTSPSFGYSAVYSLEIIVLFVSLVTLGPLVRTLPYTPKPQSTAAQPGIMEFPT